MKTLSRVFWFWPTTSVNCATVVSGQSFSPAAGEERQLENRRNSVSQQNSLGATHRSDGLAKREVMLTMCNDRKKADGRKQETRAQR